MNKTRYFLSVWVVLFGLNLRTAETPPSLPAPLGPLVEITPKNGNAFKCILLKMNERGLEVQMPSGERVTRPLDEIRNVSFVAVATPPIPTEQPAQPEAHSENEEFKKHRERLRFKYRAVALAAGKTARTEATKGSLETHISTLQTQLKNAPAEEEAKDSVLGLIFAYRQKELPPAKINELIRADIETIRHLKVREKIKEDVPEIILFLKTFRPFEGSDKPEQPQKN